MLFHELNLIFIVLLHHHPINVILLFCNAHLGAFFEEFAGSVAAKGKICPAELKIAPNLKILQIVDPSCSQSFTYQRNHLGPLAQVCF
jgi:hypothetical protein